MDTRRPASVLHSLGRFATTGMSIRIFVDDKKVERWAVVDELDTVQQLAIIDAASRTSDGPTSNTGQE